MVYELVPVPRALLKGALKLRALSLRALRMLDSIVKSKARNAVSATQLRKARQEINRCRRLMHAQPIRQPRYPPSRRQKWRL
jgi:hypothetical protein